MAEITRVKLEESARARDRGRAGRGQRSAELNDGCCCAGRLVMTVDGAGVRSEPRAANLDPVQEAQVE
jgi:hypothetical protein